MSDRNTELRASGVVGRVIASLVFVFALALLGTSQTTFALDEPTPENAPALAVPTTCTTLLGIPSPEIPEGETPSVPAAWTPLALTTTARTNVMSLTWNWSVPTSTDTDSSFRGYGFALYYGETLLANGELGPEVQQYQYAAGVDGSYRLFVWIVDDTADPATPAPTGCEYADSTYDTTGPVILGDTYSWSVNADGSLVTINDPSLLNPTFMFLGDGVYIFTLVATDSLGNITIVEFEISYAAPFIPGPEAPITPIIPAPIDPYVPPVIVKAETERTVSVGASYRAAVSTDVMTESNDDDLAASASGVSADDSNILETVAKQPVQSSDQGWLILGVPWYWWLLGVAIIGSAVQWYRSGAFRKSADDV